MLVYPMIYRVLRIPDGAGFLNHQQYLKDVIFGVLETHNFKQIRTM